MAEPGNEVGRGGRPRCPGPRGTAWGSVASQGSRDIAGSPGQGPGAREPMLGSEDVVPGPVEAARGGQRAGQEQGARSGSG